MCIGEMFGQAARRSGSARCRKRNARVLSRRHSRSVSPAIASAQTTRAPRLMKCRSQVGLVALTEAETKWLMIAAFQRAGVSAVAVTVVTTASSAALMMVTRRQRRRLRTGTASARPRNDVAVYRFTSISGDRGCVYAATQAGPEASRGRCGLTTLLDEYDAPYTSSSAVSPTLSVRCKLWKL